MKILIVSPLYPPEIAKPAPYVKKLAKRLKKNFNIKITTYSIIPEKIEGVKIVFINKHLPLFLRLFLFTIKLFFESIKTDIIYAQNGLSVELPVFVVSKITRKPYIINQSDPKELDKEQKSGFLKKIQKRIYQKAYKIINETPIKKPIITPFKKSWEYKKEYDLYENSWNNHIKFLTKTFKDAKK